MNKKIQDLRDKLLSYCRLELFIVLLVIIGFLGVFLFISKIPPQAAAIEHSTAESARSLESIFQNPLNAPYKILSLVTTYLSSTILMLRLVSFLFYAMACVAVFYAIKHWHSKQVAILTILVFSTNSIVLATARLGATLATVLGWFIFAALLLWQLHSKSNKIVPIIVLVGLAALLYTPGALWFFLILAIVYWNRFKNLFKNVRRNALLIGSIIALIIISPLVISFVRDPQILRFWLLLPETFSLGDIPRSILRVPSAYIYRMPAEPLINVGRLPVFDLSSGILFLIGLNAYRKKIKLDRTRVMIGIAIVGIILGGLGQEFIAIILILPFAFSVVAAGIEFLLDEWKTVFPKNPIAISFGVLLITCVVLFSSYYQLTRFLVVWPQTPETREVYKYPRIIQ